MHLHCLLSSNPGLATPNLLFAEGVSFFYIIALSVPGFLTLVGEQKYSGSFLVALLSINYQAIEPSTYHYLQTLVLSSILLLVSDSTAASDLDENYSQRLPTPHVKVTAGLGELILRQLLTVYSHEQFVPSVISFFHMIGPYASSFSLDVASKSLTLFEKVVINQPELTSLILECLAAMVQQVSEEHNYFLVAIIQRARWFKTIKVTDDESTNALKIIETFLERGKAAIKAKGEQKMTGLELLTLIQESRPSDLDQIVIKKHPPVFGGELETAWKTWTNMMFSGCSVDEIRSFQAFQVEYGPTLDEAFAKVNL